MWRKSNFYWHSRADDDLTVLWLAGADIGVIKDKIGCWRREVPRRAAALGLPPRPARDDSLSEWPAERVGQLRILNSSGYTAAELGNILGVSRNAVIGKAKRIGLVPVSRELWIASRATLIASGSIATGNEFSGLNVEEEAALRKQLRGDALNKVCQSTPPRDGQSQFREALLANYDRRCCVSGCLIAQIVQAAHIVPFSVIPEHRIDNGLALRADLHVLFDAGMITIDPDKYTVCISRGLLGSEYRQFDGIRTSCNSVAVMPSRRSLKWHNDRRFSKHNQNWALQTAA